VAAIRYVGATPAYADIAGVERPWLSAEAAKAAITDRTRAVMNMTYGGHPGESAELAALAAERDLILLEDAAHGLGARVDGRHLGTFGRAAALSFFSNKNLPVGEGGAVITDDEELASRVRLLRSHGMTSLTWDRHRGHASGYDVVELGFNYRIDEPRAAFATARLARLDDDNRGRARAEARYRELLEDVEGVVPTAGAGEGESAHHIFTVVLDPGLDRDAVREALAADRIQTSLHYPPVHGFSAYAQPAAALPLTEDYAARAVTLPLYPTLSDEGCAEVVDALKRAVSRA
jgi:dTDP-4-amino-4,6-dideoxygalactose transaminase